MSSAPSTNRWCERIGLPVVPCVEDFVGRRDVKLFHLMVIALLEHGGPMTIEDIARRLDAAGVTARTGDLRHSLRKAWYGIEPVYRDATGHHGLDLDAPELDLLLFRMGIRPPRVAPAEPPPVPREPPDDVPLDTETLDAAFRGR